MNIEVIPCSQPRQRGHTRLALSLTLSILAASACVCVSAGEPEPEKVVYKPMTWRPYKDVPEVLFFDGFEQQGGWIKTGKAGEDTVANSGKTVLVFSSGKDFTSMKGSFLQTPVKIPSGLQPKDLTVQFSMYADDSGTVTVKFTHGKSEYSDSTSVPKVKTWGTVTMKLSDMTKDKKRTAEPEQVITEIEISVKPPKNRKENPKVVIDDFIITHMAAPATVMPRVMAAEKKRLDMERLSERDGFAYSTKTNEFLKDHLKPYKNKRKAKSVLVMGASAEQTTAWVKSLATAPKSKENGFTFTPAGGPESGETAIGGLDDMRALIQYNLTKNPELAVILVSPADAVGPGRPVESVRVLIDRALSVGTVPIVVIPAPDKAEQATKLGTFAKTMQERCVQLGVPCIDASHTLKNAKGEVDPKALAGPPEKTAALVFAALKHTHDSLVKD